MINLKQLYSRIPLKQLYSRIPLKQLYSRIPHKVKSHAKTTVLLGNILVTIFAGYIIVPYLKNIFGWSTHHFTEHQEMVDYLESSAATANTREKAASSGGREAH